MCNEQLTYRRLSHCLGGEGSCFIQVPQLQTGAKNQQWSVQHFLIIAAINNSHRPFGFGPTEHGRLKPGGDWLLSGRLSGSLD